MSVKIGINGFGRIGRLVFRIAEQDPDVEVVAINNPSDLDCAAYLVKYDSAQGRVFDECYAEDGAIVVEGHKVKAFQTRETSELDWASVGADVVIESTGRLRDGADAKQHIAQGAKKVIISAPGTNVDATIVMGVNQDVYDKGSMDIVSNASCTTNCLAPFAKVLNDTFGIKRGLMNTIHAYTGDQQLVDKHHKDYRRARSAALSMIPTSTGAAKAVGLVLPDLNGKLDGFATRVPTPTGSMVDLTAELEKSATPEEINAAMKAAAEGPMKGVLEYCDEPIVSCDIVGNCSSSIFDSKLTKVLGGEGDFVKCVSWYDNEMGYSARCVDLAKFMMA